MDVERITAKTLIRTSNRSPHHLHMNLYQGCYHNCAYCNGTSDNYHMHKDFSTTIKAKINAPALFESFLKKKKLQPINRKGEMILGDFDSFGFSSEFRPKMPDFLVSLFGNVCDIYQPAEEELELTRQILQIAYDYGLAIRLLTKSDLVLRDLDLINQIHENSFARVAFTITLFNEEDQRNFEPNSSSTTERLKALEVLRKAGIPSGAYITPVIPFIGDTSDNLENIFSELQRVNSEFVITGGLTLKPNRNKNNFMRVIEEHYSDMAWKFHELYSNKDAYGQPDSSKAERFNLPKPVYEGYVLAKRYSMNFFEPRFIPNVKFPRNLEIATYLARIGFLKHQIYPEDTRSISEGIKYKQAAGEIEYLQKDITKMTLSELQLLKSNKNNKTLPEYIVDSINEILSTGTSTYLKEKGDFGEILYCK